MGNARMDCVFLNMVNAVTLRYARDCMLVKVLRPKSTAQGMLFQMDLQLIPSGPEPNLYVWMRRMVAAFWIRTNPPPNGMFRIMALLRRTMVTETVVAVAHVSAMVILE